MLVGHLVADVLARCGAAGDTVRLYRADRAPVGLALLADRDVAVLNPRWLEAAALREGVGADVRSRALPLVTATEYTACRTELDTICAGCVAEGSGIGTPCPPLFGGGSDSCAAVDAIPNGRNLYCAWRAFEADPSRGYCLAAHPGGGWDPVLNQQCWDPAVQVTDAASLTRRSSLWTGFDFSAGWCREALVQCAQGSGPRAWTPSRISDGTIGDVPSCAYLLEAFCDGCVRSPDGCEAIFPGSTGATDCFDLLRPENGGAGPLAWCASEAATEWLVPCYNAAGTCIDPGYWSPDIGSFDQLVLAMTGFFVRTEQCAQRAAVCRAGNEEVFPDWDSRPPTVDGATGDGGIGGDAYCAHDEVCAEDCG